MFDRYNERRLVTLGFCGFLAQSLSLGIFLVAKILLDSQYPTFMHPAIIASIIFKNFYKRYFCCVLGCFQLRTPLFSET